MNYKEVGFISFASVRFAYRTCESFYSPLLDPVDKIEVILKKTGYLQENQHLSDYDTKKEGFNIVVYNDNDKPLSITEKIRIKIAKLILP